MFALAYLSQIKLSIPTLQITFTDASDKQPLFAQAKKVLFAVFMRKT
jgi:hypothetical protein